MDFSEPIMTMELSSFLPLLQDIIKMVKQIAPRGVKYFIMLYILNYHQLFIVQSCLQYPKPDERENFFQGLK